MGRGESREKAPSSVPSHKSQDRVQRKSAQRAQKVWAACNRKAINSEEGNVFGNTLLVTLKVLF